MKHQTVESGGVRLNVVETGNPAGRPLLFIHGWSQSHFCWHRQLGAPRLREAFRLVAIDLRGHGDSEKPLSGYDDGEAWAGDVNATIGTLGLERPVLIGWSYGGYIICDYLRRYGDSALAGIVFAGASTDIGIKTPYRGRADGWDGLLPADGGAPNIYSEDAAPAAVAMRAFLARAVAQPLPYAEQLALLGAELLTPPRVRRAMFDRTCSNDDVLVTIGVPALVIHGDRDRIVHPGTALHIAETIGHAALSRYADAGHAVFLDETERFNDEIAAFAAAL